MLSKPSEPAKQKQVYYVLASEQFPTQELVDYGAAAEAAGFDGVWTSDHFQPWQPNEGHSGSAWVMLAALTQRTKRISMGTGVTCPLFRYRPSIVAQVWASLSLLAPGRIFLGLGAGEKLNEGAAGGGWAKYDERSSRLVEAVKIIRSLWTGAPVEFNGKFWGVTGKLYDPPTSQIPLYIAAGGPKSARLAGKYGDGLICGASSLRNDPMLKVAWEEGVREAGLEPASQQIIVEHWAAVGDKEDEEIGQAVNKWRFVSKAWSHGFFDNLRPEDIQKHAEKEITLEKAMEDWTISSDPSVHSEAIYELFELGASRVVVHAATPNQKQMIGYFGEKVLPDISARLKH